MMCAHKLADGVHIGTLYLRAYATGCHKCKCGKLGYTTVASRIIADFRDIAIVQWSPASSGLEFFLMLGECLTWHTPRCAEPDERRFLFGWNTSPEFEKFACTSEFFHGAVLLWHEVVNDELDRAATDESNGGCTHELALEAERFGAGAPLLFIYWRKVCNRKTC